MQHICGVRKDLVKPLDMNILHIVEGESLCKGAEHCFVNEFKL